MISQRRYLVVDDNVAFADNLAEILCNAGAQVDVAFTGGEALERVEGTSYHALISDMQMPMMNGAELIRRMRRIDPWLPTVVLTGGCESDDLLAARREGLLAVLPKSVSVAQLVNLLAAARRGGLVLLVEDDWSRLDRWTEALQTRGFAAVTARSAGEIDTLSELAPFAAVIDSGVPGPEDTAMAHLSRCFPGVPVVIAPRANRAAWDAEYLHESLDPRDLADAIERLYRGRLAA